MAELKLHLQGPQAGLAAGEFSSLLQEKLGLQVETSPSPPRDGRQDRDLATGLALAAVVLAIPGAVLAVGDLVKRFKAQDKAKVIIEISQELIERYPELSITIAGSGKTGRKLTDLEAAQLVDLTAEQEEDR